MLDIEKLLREGKTLDEIGNLITAEMDAAQKKIDAEQEALKAEIERDKKLKEAREKAIAAFKEYFSIALGEEVSEDIIRAALESVESWMPMFDNKGKKIRISLNDPAEGWAALKMLSDIAFK